ncbi:MAG TPA: hypothetical protein DDZ51_18585 [Planctomycetaceae bacterium]|nr:hypothetical protein [Planctomycetaceae bacterium]
MSPKPDPNAKRPTIAEKLKGLIQRNKPEEPPENKLLTRCDKCNKAIIFSPAIRGTFVDCPDCGNSVKLRTRYETEQRHAVISGKPTSEPKAFVVPNVELLAKSKHREYRRTCKRCGKVWHSLLSREKEITNQGNESQCFACVSCCNPTVAVKAMQNKAAVKSELGRLRSCPECGSGVYDETVV